MDLLERYFNTAFSAPNGIKRLRELILTLAMRGKLVPQDLNDSPTIELLKKIEGEKKCFGKEQNAKKLKVQDEIKPEQQPYGLPQSWAWVRFGAIAQHNSGKTLDKGRNTGTLRDYITTSNLYWGRFELDSLRQMAIRENELERCAARKGDLLICEGGEAGRAAVWSLDSEVCFQNHIHRVRFFGNVDPYFAYRFFEKLNATGEIDQYRKGVGISNMSSKALASIVFPLPPVREQHRIVAKIDLMMARCDELEKLRVEHERKRLSIHTVAIMALLSAKGQSDFSSAWEFLTRHFAELYAVKENVAGLRKAILQLAVMGKLVRQHALSPGATLESVLAEASVNGVSKGPTSDKSATEVLRISAGTSRSDFFVDEEDFKHVDLSVTEVERFKLAPGDLLACRFNGNLHYVGRFSFYQGASGRVQVNPDKLIRFRVDTKLHCPRYICYVMNAPSTRLVVEAMSATTAGNIGLSAGRLKTVSIPIPRLSLQKEIVARIEELMALCDALDLQIDACNEKKTELLNAVMAQS